MRIDYEQEIKWAQKELMKAASIMGSARMRLEGTKFDSMACRCYDDMENLNTMLVKHIRGNK